MIVNLKPQQTPPTFSSFWLHAGLEIHDGHEAFAVDTAGLCRNAPRITIYGHKWPAPFLFGAAVA